MSVSGNEPSGLESWSLAYSRMSRHWPMIRALLGGTEAMRDAGEMFLYRHEMESRESYMNRLKRSVLTNIFAATVTHLRGKAFAKPLTLGDDVPDVLKGQCENVDLNGTQISQFASTVFEDALGMGLSYILVDYPEVAPGSTLADERSVGARPYMVHLRADQVLGVRLAEDGRSIASARILEIIPWYAGWREEERKRIRVLYPDRFEVWEQTGGAGDFGLTKQGPVSLGVVPLVPVYAKKIGPFEAVPPLLDLAHLNVAHWQSASDQRNILTVARFPMLAISGYQPSLGGDGKLAVGPNQILYTEKSEGRIYYVEPTCQSIAAGRQDMEDLKAEMAIQGLQMMMPRADSGTASTATENQIRYTESTSDLQRMGFALQDALEEALRYMAAWNGIQGWQGERGGGSVSLDGSFSVVSGDSATVASLIQLRAQREITSRTLLSELKRRGLLADDFDVDMEREALELEGPEGPEETAEPQGLRSGA